MRKLPPLAEVVKYVRYRVPFLPPPETDADELPYVPRRPAVTPILPVADMDEAIVFYGSLGFQVSAYDNGYVWVRHCGWEYLHLRLVDGLEPSANAASAYVHIDDAKAWHIALSSGGADGVGDIVDQPWGKREFSFTDPSGNLVRLGQSI